VSTNHLLSKISFTFSRITSSPVLSSFGVFSIAVTVIESLDALEALAKWVKILSERWIDILQNIWIIPFSWFGIELHPFIALLISSLLFLAIILYNSIVSIRRENYRTIFPKSFLIDVGRLGAFLCFAFVGIVPIIILSSGAIKISIESGNHMESEYYFSSIVFHYVIMSILAYSILFVNYLLVISSDLDI